MFEWWKRRKAKQEELERQERRMRDALAKLEEASPDQLNGHEVETIEKEVTEAADAAVAILEPKAANGSH